MYEKESLHWPWRMSSFSGFCQLKWVFLLCTPLPQPVLLQCPLGLLLNPAELITCILISDRCLMKSSWKGYWVLKHHKYDLKLDSLLALYFWRRYKCKKKCQRWIVFFLIMFLKRMALVIGRMPLLYEIIKTLFALCSFISKRKPTRVGWKWLLSPMHYWRRAPQHHLWEEVPHNRHKIKYRLPSKTSLPGDRTVCHNRSAYIKRGASHPKDQLQSWLTPNQ